MFTTLNQRWLIELQEREMRSLKRLANNPQLQNCSRNCCTGFKQPT
jgi:hypothetical protein